MNYSIVPNAEIHFTGLHRALDIVAREKKYLAFLRAPPLEDSLRFYRHIVANDLAQFLAIDGEQVVGWCDILPSHGEARSHVGHLGMGLVPSARQKGLGAKLLQATLSKAFAKGVSRIELTVRVDNLNAKALYERFGFKIEGTQVRSNRIEGAYYDAYAMALISERV